MKRKKHKKRKVWPIILVVLTVLIVMAAAAVFLFRTRSYKVEGNSYYGERTITTWIENDPLSVNSLYVLYKYNFTDADLPSGVESLSISLKDPWTVKVKVKEKEMAGYVDYDGAYLYFDRTGTAVLRTKKIIEGVPHIEGLMFDSAKAKIGKKLPVEDDSIFEKIVEVSKNLKKYNLTPDRMGCTDGGVQIYFEIVHKYISFRAAGQERFTRTKTLGPFVISNKNYGILWDSYSYCRWGNPGDYHKYG